MQIVITATEIQIKRIMALLDKKVDEITIQDARNLIRLLRLWRIPRKKY